MDRWLFWPASVSLAVVTVLAFVCGLPGPVSFIMIPISIYAAAIAAIAFLIVSLVFAARKRPRRAASFLFVLVAPLLLLPPINWVADCVHLGLTAWFGEGQLGSNKRPKGTGFEVFDWSVGFAGGPLTFLIRDQTDEIALPMARHTQPADSEHGFGEDCAGRVRHLFGHYYVCTF